LPAESLYGQDVLNFVQGFQNGNGHSAYEATTYLLTHGGNLALSLALDCLGFNDRAVFDVLAENQFLMLRKEASYTSGFQCIRVYVNSLGKLHFRRADEPMVLYATKDRALEFGFVTLPPELASEVHNRVCGFMAVEKRHFAKVRRAM